MKRLGNARKLAEERMKHKPFWANHFAELLTNELHTHANLILHDSDCSFFVTKKESCDCALLVLVNTINPPKQEG